MPIIKKLIAGALVTMGLIKPSIAGNAVNSALKNDFNAYSFSFTHLDGSKLSLGQYSGKVVLIVNTASNCGFTKQYQGLEELWEEYKEKGLIVVAVPSNDFGGQEPGNDKEIHNFCEAKYNVTFPIVNKEHVKGNDAHPFYAWAAERAGILATPKWNFHKYLIDKNGQLASWFASTTEPTSAKMKEEIEKLLNQ